MEYFTPGYYTVTSPDGLLERGAMTTVAAANVTGKYANGEPLAVYQVYPTDKANIVWGRVSMSDDLAARRYVALIVNNHPKVKFERAFPTPQDNATLIDSINRLQESVERLLEKLTKALLS